MILTIDILVCLVVGVLAPFVTKGVTKLKAPEPVETFLNLLIAAGISTLMTTPFNGNWQEFLLAFATAWFATGRVYLTKLPAALYVMQTTGKHEAPEDESKL